MRIKKVAPVFAFMALCGFSCAWGSSPGIATSSIPDDTVGSPYSVTLAVSGGTAPYTWAIVGGALPPGLTLNTSTGLISGTPGVSGPYNFWVNVTDSTGNISPPQDYGFNIWPPPVVTSSTLLSGILNNPYSATLTAAGGLLPYANWTVVSGSLPPGFTLNPATGIVPGIPTVRALYASVGCFTAAALTISANALHQIPLVLTLPLFTAGILLIIVGIGCQLMELGHSNRTLRTEIADVVPPAIKPRA